MKGKYKFLTAAAMSALLLAACGSDEETTVSKELELTQESKMVIDELNREVEIPAQLYSLVMGSVLT